MSVLSFPTSFGSPVVESFSSKEVLRFAVECARLAPSGHNRQPWQFRMGTDYIDLLADTSRELPFLDPNGRELTISCGVALFYLRLAFRYQWHQDTIELLPDANQPNWIARVRLGEPLHRSAADSQLFHAISRRHTSRLAFFTTRVPEGLMTQLTEVASQEGASLQIVRDLGKRASVARLVEEGVYELSRSPTFRAEMCEWFHPDRENSAEGVAHLPDEIGIPLTQSNPLVSPNEGSKLLARQEKAFATEAPLLVALGTSGDTQRDWLTAGQALAHFLLLAAAHGINAAYLNQPIQVEYLRPPLKEAIGLSGHPQLLMAIGYAPAVSSAPRRPLEEVLVHE